MEKVILELKNTPDKSNLEDAERMLRSFYRTIEPHYKRKFWKEPERISWEIYAEKDKICFYVVVPKRLENLIKNRIIDAYPQVEIKKEENDYTEKFTNPFTAEMNLNKHYMFATKTKADDTPLNSLLNSMTRLDKDEKMLLQITLLPINNKWQGVAYKHYRNLLFNGKKPNPVGKSLLWKGVSYSIKGIFKPLDWLMSFIMDIPSGDDAQKNTPIERKELKGTQEKIALPAFNASVRMAVESRDKNIMSGRLSEMANSFIEVDGDNEWRRKGKKTENPKLLVNIKERAVDKRSNNKVTTSELAPLIRLANGSINVAELAKKLMKTQPIPEGLHEGVYLGQGLHRSEEIGLYNSVSHVDSLVHPWMVSGAMGGGKTTLITNMMLARAIAGYGVIILDTQGDMSHDFLAQLPPEHHDRVVWLNFGDIDYPIALDMLETIPTDNPRHQKFMNDFAEEELITMFKRMFGTNFGPQTEYIVRNIVTATVTNGTSSFIEMFRMLVDDQYRDEVTRNLRSVPFCWQFWRTFQTYTVARKAQMMMPSINKIGAFVKKQIITNITCQGLGSQNYHFRDMMDEGKIVVVTIPKGKLIGTWDLIGRLIISKIWLATLSRENVPISQRRPCFLAVDEAEDLIEGNENFDIMLSQSRKYRLGLVFGFQYLKQVKAANRKVYDALIGNKPSIVALKIGTDDADTYESIFRPHYTKEEMDFPDLHGIAKLNISGTYSTPFTLKIPYNFFTRDNSTRTYNEEGLESIQANSRKLYAKPLEEVEGIVADAYAYILEGLSKFEVPDEEMDGKHDQEMSDDALENLRRI